LTHRSKRRSCARAVLKEEGSGVLSEIDIKEKFKEKFGVDFRRYVILGACNPTLAYKTLQEEIEIDLLLPCIVSVCDTDESGKPLVGAVDAKAMLSVAGNNPTLDAGFTEVNETLWRVIDELQNSFAVSPPPPGR